MNYQVRRVGNKWKFIAEKQHAESLQFRDRDNAVIREYRNRRTVTFPFERGPETLERVRTFFRSRKRDEYITFRIGDKSPFRIAIHSMRDFNAYINMIESKWEQREEETGHESPFPYLQIVEVKRA